MNRQIILIVALLSGANIQAMEKNAPAADSGKYSVEVFDKIKDMKAVLALLQANPELIQRPGLTAQAVLQYRTLTPADPKTYGSLIIKVLRDLSAQMEEDTVKAFGAYTKSRDAQDRIIVQGLLIAVKEGERKEGLALHLMRTEIDELLKADAGKFWAMSKDSMTQAHALYIKVAQLYPELEFIRRRATTAEVRNPNVKDVQVFELQKK